MTPLPQSVAVGAGTALFIDGACALRDGGIRKLEVGLGDAIHPALGWELPRPQTRTGRDYWWAILPIDAVEAPIEAPLTLRATLAGGGTAEAPLGSLRLLPRLEPPEFEPPAPPSGAVGPLVAICMATYEPEPDLLRRQIESIRAQTHSNWICLISDDGSSPAGLEAIERVVGGDPRFAISPAEHNAGLYANFERALLMVPPEADFVAYCDQDDVWHADKLEKLLAGLEPGALLVYADMRVVAEDGEVISDTYWSFRRNNHTDFASLVLANTVTGAAMLFDASLLQRALPFPPHYATMFHDHWLAQVAMALGPISYVDRPLHDYVQHGGAALGHIAANGSGRFSGPRLERVAATWAHFRDHGYRLAWRAPYFNVYCRVALFAEALRRRCGDRMTADRLAVLDRIVDSPRGIAWLLSRSARELTGASETLGRERRIVAGLAWRRMAVTRSRLRRGPPS